MRPRHRSIVTRLVSLVFITSLVPASLLIGVSWFLNNQVRLQMERDVDDALDLAISLEQQLIDGRLTRMRERAVALAGHPALPAAMAAGAPLRPLLEGFRNALPGADLIAVVDPGAVVRGRAGSGTTGDPLHYGGLVRQALDGRTASSAVVVITRAELLGESPQIMDQVRVPILETRASTDHRAGQVLEDALALVGAAPIIDEAGQLLGAVLVADILNNDHAIVDEVAHRSPAGLPVHATIALDGIRVTTTVPAVGGGKRAVGTLYSDPVMEELRAGRPYRGRAIVGGWQWQRTIYLPLRDPSGQVVAGAFVGIPEAAFADLVRSHTYTMALAIAAALLSVLAAVIVAHRLALTQIAHPLQRFARMLTESKLHVAADDVHSAEMSALASALNDLTDRVRRTVAEMARVSRGVQDASDALAGGAQEAAENAEAALQLSTNALAAAERLGGSTQQAVGRLRELEVALARIDVAGQEQARVLKHAGHIIDLVTQAVLGGRDALGAVLESIRSAVASVQQARHSILRTISSLDLARLEAQGIAVTGAPAAGETPGLDPRLQRLLADLEEGLRAANECEEGLRQIARSAEAAVAQLWELAAVQNESGARAGAVRQQMADLAAVVDGTAAQIRAMSDVSRQVIGQMEAMAGSIESEVALVREGKSCVANIAEASRRLQALSERIRALAGELDQAVARFPR